jgi:hypothetical protein
MFQRCSGGRSDRAIMVILAGLVLINQLMINGEKDEFQTVRNP